MRLVKPADEVRYYLYRSRTRIEMLHEQMFKTGKTTRRASTTWRWLDRRRVLARH